MQHLIYRVMSRADWEKTLANQLVPLCGSDERDGFVHLSTADTMIETANLYFEPGEKPVIAEIDANALGNDLKWEVVTTRNDTPFPHLYAAGVPIHAITAFIELHHDASGFSLGPKNKLPKR